MNDCPDDALWRLSGPVSRGEPGSGGGFVFEVDLCGGEGEILGLTGDIGSGKSTILAVLGGRCPVETATLTWRDRPWTPQSDPAPVGSLVRDSGSGHGPKRTAILAQRPIDQLAEDRTGIEQLTDLGVAEPEVRSALTEVGVDTGVAERLPWTFSGAEAQRIALVAAVLAEPDLLLLDEPASMADKRTRARSIAWLASRFAERHGAARSTVVASTDESLLDSLCQRVVSLD